MSTDSVTLTSGMRANLVSLQKTNDLLEITQKRLSTGKKVNIALDDPVTDFTALEHEQRAIDLASRKDEMSESTQTVKAEDAGISSINTLIASGKSLATSALSGETTSDINTLMSQFNQVLSQIDTIADNSGYKSVNLLDSSELSGRNTIL
jgi:flagellin